VDLDAYIAENAGHWRRLERLARMNRLTVDEVDELMALYQRTGAQLSVLRSKAPDPLLLAWLSRVLLAARGRITGGVSFSWRPVARFFTATFPLAVYQARRWWVSVTVLSLGTAGLIMSYIANHPEVQNKLLPPAEAQDLVNHEFGGYYHTYPAQHFALQVWTNNAYLTGKCLAAGILILPVFYLLFQNMLNLGADGGFMIAYGHGSEFFALITPHGLLELTAVFIAAGAGLQTGWAWIAPGRGLTRGRAVAESARSAMLIALGLILVLGVSGLLEAFVTPSPLGTGARIAIGAAVWLAFVGYVFVAGRRAAQSHTELDLDPSLRAATVPSI
jgi:uncharacterized membrane protein SpoIIM required for sporulation